MLNSIIKEYVSSKAKDKLEKKHKEIIGKIEEEEKKGRSYIPTDEENAVISRYDNFDSNIEDECRAWMIEISELAGQRKFSTHIPKFIHPDISCFSNIIVTPCRRNDGYIRTGNVARYLDSFGNAAAMPATELLSLLIDGKPLYDHITEKTDVGTDFINFFGDRKEYVIASFMKMLSPSDVSSTDSKARQVFFPVEDECKYHIITPLMSSPVMNQLVTALNKNRAYNNNPTGSEAKTPQRAKDLEEKGEYLEGGYWTLFDTVNINYGGTKPQNISNFNNKVKTIRLLKSMPPEIRHRKIRIPVSSFFSDSVYVKASRYSDLFMALDKIFKSDIRNRDIRDVRDSYYHSLLEEIASDIAAVRNEISFNEGEYRGSLDSAEYMMLYEDDKRYEDHKWLESISDKFTRWFFDSYRKIVNKPYSFGDAEYRHVLKFASENEEAFIQ